ncbi:malto-oligosyltrehalose trehalohydrolase [Luteitalea sp. TBR-22]|uniref:malto-oligosyltrehalose trehalohydrolase n=1 Tax=Luteitalea sp. TBR-22 TaxID=2802971 RepID=UPI001EF4B544|nr:malto-oligosyltrehalose trehalohydrolase [Luteitalea sp. TBR-22]BCS33655.2 malto-oligosyltrehalose trehalohydrolase [Luteitalea sp. TBR-22]
MPLALPPSMVESTPLPTRPVTSRRLSVGAEIIAPGMVSVRVWAPDHARVAVVMDAARHVLAREPDGHHSGEVPGRAGSRYAFLLGDDPTPYPDPASRFQPDGPHDLSEVIDPRAYTWEDGDWPGVDHDHAVLYELHLGSFTPEGTTAAATTQLEALAALGVTVLQVMPVADFPGAFGWGYDGVNLYAPSRLYGRPDDLRRFVDRAHALGLAVVLDVVYNHVGPDGNYLRKFSQGYFTDRYDNEWGDALDFDGPESAPVRAWVLDNVAYWVDEFHVDGFRLDATQQIFDASPEHLVAAVARVARATAGPRRVLVTAENEPQHARLVTPVADGGHGLDAIYNEDFHHSARMALVGTHEAYFSDYHGTPAEWLACARWGALFQGQHYAWQKQARGTPALHLPRSTMVHFLENHDQVANTDRGRRLVDLARPSDLRALTALCLLMPGIPMLFQGQEFGSRAPFLYFADHVAPLREAVAAGRRQFLEQFERLRDPDVQANLAVPHSPDAFHRCKLRRSPDDDEQGRWLALHTDLLALRRRRPRLAGAHRLDGSTPDAFLLLLRYFGDGGADWLVLVNMGADRDVASLADPLVAPPGGREWQHAWSSEQPAYGGQGTMAWTSGHWPVPGHACLVLQATPVRDREVAA